MKTRNWVIFSGLLLAGLWLVAAAFLPKSQSDGVIHEVGRGPLQVWTSYDGVIQSRTVRGVSSQLGGSATIVELIPEGTYVVRGTPLVELDASGYERELIRVQRELSLARAEFESLTKARLPLEKREMEIRLWQARSELDDAENALADLRELIDEGLVPEHDAIQQEKKTALLKATVENIEQQMALTLDFLQPAALDRAQAQLASAEREWAVAQRQLDQSRILAPSDGIVVYQPLAIGSEFRTVRVGDTVYKNQVFISLPDMSNLIVQVDVPEYELTLAQTGRPVVVQPVSYPGMRLNGVIESVGSMAQTRPDRPSRQKFFQVVIRLLEIRPELRSGMSARAQVLSYDISDAVLIPRSAVQWENNEPFVWLAQRSRRQRERITLGMAGVQEYVVVDGLQAGQRIVIP
ncbi:MAG TPA: efflux RND transporter periplasmic adaptor subunit [Kiritimatiellia bacterium]|nr:efflux RND transporter periplasmic adaptor subunit [Kiritimatiellia bacterium]